MSEPQSDQPLLFASYSRQDFELVGPVIRAVEAAGVDVWLDVEELQAGMDWEQEIRAALERADGILVFLSPDYLTSSLLVRELNVVAARGGLVIPVMIRPIQRGAMSSELQRLEFVDLRGGDTDLALAAERIAKLVTGARSARVLSSGESAETARVLAESHRAAPVDDGRAPQSVFLVHGHDDEFLAAVEDFLKGVGVKTIVLKRAGGSTQSLLQKFLQFGSETRFAIVLITGDDLGAARRQYDLDGVADRALQFRARQNVVLELGYFYGLLGWEHVFVLRKAADKPFPNFEMPSDLAGTVFDRYDASGEWRDELSKRLSKAGFEIAERQGHRLPT